jgi:hypothetical protein
MEGVSVAAALPRTLHREAKGTLIDCQINGNSRRVLRLVHCDRIDVLRPPTFDGSDVAAQFRSATPRRASHGWTPVDGSF